MFVKSKFNVVRQLFIDRALLLLIMLIESLCQVYFQSGILVVKHEMVNRNWIDLLPCQYVALSPCRICT